MECKKCNDRGYIEIVCPACKGEGVAAYREGPQFVVRPCGQCRGAKKITVPCECKAK